MFARPLKSLKGSEQLASLPAPIGGLNTSSPAMNMPATDCMVLFNMLAAENGLRARLGSREWVTGLSGEGDSLVRTVIPYTGTTPTATRLFVTTSTGIWDVTASSQLYLTFTAGVTTYEAGDIVQANDTLFTLSSATGLAAVRLPKVWAPSTAYTVAAGDRTLNDGSVYLCTQGGISGLTGPMGGGVGIVDGTCLWANQSPDSTISDASGTWAWTPDAVFDELVYEFASSADDAGYGVCHAHTTTAGNFIWYADEENGLHLYTESTDTWAPVTGITGVTETDLCFVTVFKGFTLFAEKGTSNIWILDVNSIAGAATRLGVGYKLQAGGDIVGMWSWTYDGGGGLDDSLVVVTRGGDVIVFQGTDPTDSSAFGITGVWGVGKMPAGRNVATAFGGDLLLLTRAGIVPMSRLVLGRSMDAAQYETAKIHNLFNQLMLSYGDVRGWSLTLHPEESALIVTVPTGDDLPTTQLAMSLGPSKAWSQLRDLDIYSCAAYEGKLYYGTVDGKVGINDGNVDGVTLEDPNEYTAIQYSGVSAFQNMGSGTQKQVHLVKPYFLSQSTAPSFRVGARYDFNLTELDSVALSAASGSVWDTGRWDTAVWGGAYSASTGVRGAKGMGSNIALAWRGASVDRTVLTGFELSFSTGGML